MNPTVLVTGAAAGIGAATVRRLSADGASVVALDRDAEALDRLAAQIPGVLPVAADLTDDEATRAALAPVGDLDGLVCAAGIQTYGRADEPDAMAVFDTTVGVNLRGVYLATHLALPRLSARRGSIVVVASVQAYQAQAGVAAYASTKGALLALVRALAVDHAAQGIRVNAVCPGSVDTPMLRWAARRAAGESGEDALVAQWGRSHPLGRVADPAEVADAIAYLLSDRASFITGTDLRVDGGLTAGIAVVIPE